MLLAAATVTARAQDADVTGLSLEQLANVEITSVSRRPEQLSRAPAAVFVITAEDIRRSSFGTLPDVLRLAPNLEVAKMNGYGYTVTARGFNSPESANKLLVLIDGRSVYSPLASTVFWENIDLPLSNIERIEVVSGPGGTLWGANAVNGVINIITKNAKDAQGGLAETRVGISGSGVGGHRSSLRYGITPWEGGSIYLYGLLSRSNGTPPLRATDTTRTGWMRADAGFRFDQALENDTFFLEGELYANHNPGQELEKARGGNLNSRWTHKFGNGDSFFLQLLGDNYTRIVKGNSREVLTTYDIQGQYNMSLTGKDVFVWGGEYKQFKESFYSLSAFGFANPHSNISVENLFAQDEIPVFSDLKLTLGLKAENNSYSGLNWMPNVRLAWQTSDTGMIWGAISQAVRTPSKVDRELQLPGILLPSPLFDTEKLTAYELGYRGQPLPQLSLSVSGFFNVYSNLRSDAFTPVTIVPIQLVNGTEGNTYGLEIWGNYSLADWWRINFGANWLNKNFGPRPGFADLARGQSEGQDPATQLQARSQMNPFRDWEFDFGFRAVAPVKQKYSGFPDLKLVPGYLEADVRIGWHIFPSTEIDFSGLNLLHERHLEANDPSSFAPQYVPRSFIISLRQSF